MTVDLNNTFVIQTDDENFINALRLFLSQHCDDNKVNEACYDLNEIGGKKVMDIVYEI